MRKSILSLVMVFSLIFSINLIMCQVTANDGETDGITLNSTDLAVLWNITFDVRSGEDIIIQLE